MHESSVGYETTSKEDENYRKGWYAVRMREEQHNVRGGHHTIVCGAFTSETAPSALMSPTAKAEDKVECGCLSLG